MRRAVVLRLLLVFPASATVLQAQAPAGSACSDSLTKTIAFLQGSWEGRSFSIVGRDTVLDALMKVQSRPLLGPCALEERWEATKGGQILFTAKVVRAYDAPTQRWMVYYVDDQLNSQIYEGRREAAQWRFIRTRLDRGVPIQVRLTWRPTKDGYEQLIERSQDGGSSWSLGGFVSFSAIGGSGRP